MNKITKTSECPYRDKISDKYFCDHPSMIIRHCSWTNHFPASCPLKKEEYEKIEASQRERRASDIS